MQCCCCKLLCIRFHGFATLGYFLEIHLLLFFELLITAIAERPVSRLIFEPRTYRRQQLDVHSKTIMGMCTWLFKSTGTFMFLIVCSNIQKYICMLCVCVCVYINTHTHTHTYIYIYIYKVTLFYSLVINPHADAGYIHRYEP